MRLELFLSETTPVPVRNQLLEGIQRSPLPIKNISLQTFPLPTQGGENYWTLFNRIPALLAEVDAVDEDAIQILPLPEVGRVETTGLRSVSRRRYYNVGPLLQSPSAGEDLRLVGLPHRAAMVEYFDYGYLIDKIEPWNTGIWFTNLKTGIVTLSSQLSPRNLRTALHELGHGFDLEHHVSCVMQQGRQPTQDFCPPCIETLKA